MWEGCNPTRAVGGPGDVASALTHRAGGTHPVYGVGPPARWAEVYFPTGINLGQCSVHIADTSAQAAQTLVIEYLW